MQALHRHLRGASATAAALTNCREILAREPAALTDCRERFGSGAWAYLDSFAGLEEVPQHVLGGAPACPKLERLERLGLPDCLSRPGGRLVTSSLRNAGSVHGNRVQVLRLNKCALA